MRQLNTGPAMKEQSQTKGKTSRRLRDDEDAHEEDHHEEDPHEEPIHHLGDLLPLGCLDARGSLLTEAVGNVLDILHHLWNRATQVKCD